MIELEDILLKMSMRAQQRFVGTFSETLLNSTVYLYGYGNVYCYLNVQMVGTF